MRSATSTDMPIQLPLKDVLNSLLLLCRFGSRDRAILVCERLPHLCKCRNRLTKRFGVDAMVDHVLNQKSSLDGAGRYLNDHVHDRVGDGLPTAAAHHGAVVCRELAVAGSPPC